MSTMCEAVCGVALYTVHLETQLECYSLSGVEPMQFVARQRTDVHGRRRI